MDHLHPLPGNIPVNHFLALPRPDHGLAEAGTPDTSTLAAHDFDVDTRTGFMPPRPLLKRSEVLLRRAHHVLAWVMHFYIHSLPVSTSEIHIPPPVTLPLLQFRGVEALTLMRAMMDEAFLGDATAIRRITTYLHTLAGVAATRRVLQRDPALVPRRGLGRQAQVGLRGHRARPALGEPTELSGPSAGQSSLVHALDVFLASTNCPTAPARDGRSGPATATFSSAPGSSSVPFLTRMQSYMPRHHRAFLRHLSSNPRPLRTSWRRGRREAAGGVFRDEHVKIVALYILVPSKKAQAAAGKTKEEGAAKGTGGTDAFQFVKGVRDQTAGALLKPGQ
ncbi:uncharacterized protein B0H18DRAFT_1086002 [Fomitopsis serialis]|uniref:uncharacterized protein n=1 Tax=Fomitopsis serialis TaxID=139415 RepID=UPI002008B8A6|nr:uncharacterized protein B0H18DRAFT_1086002 [Neoantrodia serialis]KAH9921846.1 hypothetical protein B0H18DRAFT_1086002 [Neoantrodia serialis]